MREAGLKRREDAGLGIVAHGDDEGKAVFGDIVGVQALELRRVLGIGQRIEGGAGLFGGGLPRVRCLAAASLPARSGWACSTPRRSAGLAERKMRASALCRPAALSWAGPSSRSKARSAIQGECSKMEP